jgi:RNA polymerase sigma-70 factor (ECF subfamily)
MGTRADGSGEIEATSSVELIARVRSGDEQARDALLARYRPRMERWAHGRLPSCARGAADTQDIVQEALLQVARRISMFEPRHDAAFQSYVRKALFNRIRDLTRLARRRPTADALDAAIPASTPSPLEEAVGQEALERYEAALGRLKAADRQAVIVRVEMGLSNAEVAQALGKPTEAAAHMAVSRALVRLAQEMTKKAPMPTSQPKRRNREARQK